MNIGRRRKFEIDTPRNLISVIAGGGGGVGVVVISVAAGLEGTQLVADLLPFLLRAGDKVEVRQNHPRSPVSSTLRRGRELATASSIIHEP